MAFHLAQRVCHGHRDKKVLRESNWSVQRPAARATRTYARRISPVGNGGKPTGSTLLTPGLPANYTTRPVRPLAYLSASDDVNALR